MLAIIPFGLMNSTIKEDSKLVRVTRMGRLYKLVKLNRLLKMLKVLKLKTKIKIMDGAKQGYERMLFFMMIFLILIHIVACCWVIIPQFQNPEDNNYTGTWLEDYIEGNTPQQLYTLSVYWTITTVTTIGYGDISGTNTIERIFCSLMMVIGVISFSFMNGSLTSILANHDQKNAALNKKIQILNSIHNEYVLPLDLYMQCKKNLEQSNKSNMN